MGKLNIRAVASASDGLHSDGDNLYLSVNSIKNAKSWIFRYSINGKRREMGIGSASLVSLSEAREIAYDLRKLLKSGIDPLEHRKNELLIKAHNKKNEITFQQAAEKYIEAHQAGWSNHKHAKQWQTTLSVYAYPYIGEIPVSEITLQDIIRVLSPIWFAKTETAARVRSRIQKILDWSIALGYRKNDNPARSELVTTQVPSPSKVKKIEHHKAIPYTEISEFIFCLRKTQSVASLALEFLIQTASRTSEVTGAKWTEIDLAGKTWTIPAQRMKMRKEHRVPLNTRCIEILHTMQEFDAKSDYIFPGRDKNSRISDMTMSRHLKRMGRTETVHGFRSTFKDWAAEQTNHPNIISEQALAHVVGGVEAAYRRGDLLAKRAILMEEWCSHLNTKKNKANVTSLLERNAA